MTAQICLCYGEILRKAQNLSVKFKQQKSKVTSVKMR
jgi:hypothetical protein